MFKVSVPHNMKIGYDSHDFAFTQLAGFNAFPCAITQLMCLQFFDKCLIKIVNGNFSLFSILFMDSSFIWLVAITNLGRIHFYMYLYIK